MPVNIEPSYMFHDENEMHEYEVMAGEIVAE